MTFPFLFGVMFGDMGHASVLTIASLWMCLNEATIGAKPVGEIFGMAFKGRWMLLMMGFFSI
jgi:V-type H+-transporting ATPase subunit a